MQWRILVAFQLILIAMVTTGCQTAKPSSDRLPISKATLKERIDAVLAEKGQNAQIGMQIISTSSGEVLYQKSPDQLFTPASTLKLYTAAAALHYLGPSYRFETKAFVDGQKKGRVHNVYLQGSGDPSFSTSDLSQIAQTLKQYKITQIAGDLVMDDTRFDGVQWGSGWMWDDMHKGFSAPVSAINVDYNRVVVYAKPGETKGEAVKVTLEPYTQFIKLDVDAKTSAESTPNQLTITCNDNNEAGLLQGQTIKVSGSLAQNSKTDYETFSIKDPSLFAGFLLKEELLKNGIRFKGEIKRGKTPDDAKQVAKVLSRPLGEAIIDFVKISNNQASESLLKAIAVKQSGEPASFDAGLQAVRTFLTGEAKVAARGLVVSDGSGLSRYSLTSPAQMTRMLTYMWNNFRIGPEFIASLPIGGEDGTLSRRWQNSDLRGRVRAKTGSMANMSALVGYVSQKSGDVLSFAIMINASANGRAVDREIVDLILSAASET
jgi:D-alanyl-D-alanine carboxypeptidase/D-alanyl-D-alanine-endopeptidase (penicillin-binding protein 4)